MNKTWKVKSANAWFHYHKMCIQCKSDKTVDIYNNKYNKTIKIKIKPVNYHPSVYRDLNVKKNDKDHLNLLISNL